MGVSERHFIGSAMSRSFDYTTEPIKHNLGTTGVFVQVYDEVGILYPDAFVQVIDANHVRVACEAISAGTVVIAG